jgi:glutamine cyclotransferase
MLAGIMLTTQGSADVPVYGYDLINTYPHDSGAFTQGLYYKDGYLYESTGLYGKSSVRKVVPETGVVMMMRQLNSSYFGEGLTIRDTLIYQITWREQTGFVYVEHLEFDLIDTFNYPTDGWGLTHDDTSLIMSDGSSRLYHLDLETYEHIDTVFVTADGSPVTQINEMEMIRGKIYANILHSDMIAVIEPSTGEVESWLDLTGIGGPSPPGPLNGIAFQPDSVHLYVTGKYWPELYEIWVAPLDYRPEILGSDPRSPVCAYIDSTIALSVSAVDLDPLDSLEYTWSVNGVVDGSAQDSSYEYTGATSTVDTVEVWVSDGIFSDSTSWIINVEIAGIPDRGENQAALYQNHPNPFRLATTLRFTAFGDGESGRVTLAIHDVHGRLVKTLIDSDVAPGDHETVWDGTDGDGKRVSPGIFFSVLKTGRGRLSRKMTLLE